MPYRVTFADPRARVREGWGVGTGRRTPARWRAVLRSCPRPIPSAALWEPRFVIAKPRGGSARVWKERYA